MRALVTGITGFAGSFLAEHLLASGDQVWGCSKHGHWPPGMPPDAVDRIPVVPWDLALEAPLAPRWRRAIEQYAPDSIYHLAGISVPADCGAGQPTSLATATIVAGTGRVLELAASLSSRPRVLYVSSSHVYAPVSSEKPILSEDAPLGPTHGYARAKLAAERLVSSVADRLDVVTVRSFQHAGPRQQPRLMLAEWAQQFAQRDGVPVRVHTCDAWIDLTDVRDVVRAYRLIMGRGRRGGVYNLGSGISRRSGDLLEVLRKIADPARPIVEIRPGWKQDPIADAGRLRHETGWQPAIPPEQTVAETYAWWVDAPRHRRTAAKAPDETVVNGR